MTVKFSKQLISQYERSGDHAISQSDYLTALRAYSIAYGVLITIDQPHESKYVAGKSFDLRNKLDNCKDLFEQFTLTTLNVL